MMVLPDILSYDRTRPAHYPNGCVPTDDAYSLRWAWLSNGKIPRPASTPRRPAGRVPLPRPTQPLPLLAWSSLTSLLEANTDLTRQDKDLTEQVAELAKQVHALLTAR